MSLDLKPVTATILRREIKASFEDHQPWEAIADVMAEDAGKPFTVRHAREVAKRLGVWHNDDESRPAHAGRVWLLRETGYRTSEIVYQPAGCAWDDSRACTIWRDSFSETIPKLCPTREQIEKLNPAHYGAREKRNVRRTALLDDPSQLQALAREMNKARRALTKVSALFVHNEPCEVEQYRLARAWGWDNSKGVYL